jgi:hypothetical protein
VSEVRQVLARVRSRTPRGVEERLTALEAELQEHRQLSRRVAELTDLVADLLVPLARHDQAEVEAIVNRYRASI